tara:strand:- start:293 stop:1141 length:849 start_codon:yes stop_codon:yes gene_type:complete
MPYAFGAAAGGAFPQLTITQSQTWVPPQDGTVCIHVVGAGGGGSGWYASGAGGGAGAYFKIPSLAVTTSGSFTLVVGVGGAGGFLGSGVTGGASTVAGTGLTGTKTAGGGGHGTDGGTDGAGGQVSGSGESFVGYTGGAAGGVVGAGGAVGVHATGQAGGWNTVDSSQTFRSDFRSCQGGVSDAAAGGLSMSGFGIICGGSQSGDNSYSQDMGQSYSTNGQDLCGGGGMQSGGINQFVIGGAGGIGGGGGSGWNSYNTYSTYRVGAGGRGGDGIILIQYLPW